MTGYDAFWRPGSEAHRPSPAQAAAVYRTSPLSLRSRCARFALPGQEPIWIKRDDELSFGASGSKVRKYASLVPFLVGSHAEEVIVLGARNSNNVLAAAQFLTEANLRCHLLLRQPADPDLPDTVFDLIRLVVPAERIVHVARRDWHRHAEIVENLRSRLTCQGRVVAVVPEGGSLVEALPGAMTLGLDIARNEAELARRFTDVFVEAGTGLTAIGLALGLAAAARPRPPALHVLCTAVLVPRFLALYRRWTSGVPGVPPVRVHDTPHDRAGAPPGPDLSWLTEVTGASGVLLDPDYSGRLVWLADRALRTGSVGAEPLLVHTGGMGLLRCLERARAGMAGGRR